MMPNSCPCAQGVSQLPTGGRWPKVRVSPPQPDPLGSWISAVAQISQSKSESSFAHTFPNVEGLVANRIPNMALTGCQPSAVSFPGFPCKMCVICSDNLSHWCLSAATGAGWGIGASPQWSSLIHHMEPYVFTHQNQWARRLTRQLHSLLLAIY